MEVQGPADRYTIPFFLHDAESILDTFFGRTNDHKVSRTPFSGRTNVSSARFLFGTS